MFATMLQDFIIALIKTITGIVMFFLSIPVFFIVFIGALFGKHFEIQRKNKQGEDTLGN